MPTGHSNGPNFRKGIAFGAHRKHKCDMCNGTGQVLVNPSDSRAGTKSCPNCNGEGER